MNPRIEVPMNRGQLYRVLDISARTLSELLASGVIVPVIPGKGRRPSVFDAMVAIPAALRHERQKPRPGESARDLRDKAQAEYVSLRTEERRGELVPRDRVIAEGRSYSRTLSERVIGLGRRLLLAGIITGDRLAEVEGICSETLEELVAWAEFYASAPRARGPEAITARGAQ